MRCAKGFAIGKGRARGVLGMRGAGAVGMEEVEEVDAEVDEDAEDVGSAVVSMMSSSEVSEDGGGISSFGSGGMGGSLVPPPCSREGNSAAGEGGGRTKVLVRIAGEGGAGAAMLVLNSGGGLTGEGGIDEGITSVSYAGVTLLLGGAFALGDMTTPRPEERRDTRVLRGLAAFPFSFRGDLRGELRTATEGGMAGTGAASAGAGVGGRSASIFSTSQERFSSRSFSRSACETRT